MYTLPGIYSNKAANNIKEKLTGKTYFDFEVQAGGCAGNNQVTIISKYHNGEDIQSEFESMIIYFLANSV